MHRGSSSPQHVSQEEHKERNPACCDVTREHRGVRRSSTRGLQYLKTIVMQVKLRTADSKVLEEDFGKSIIHQHRR